MFYDNTIYGSRHFLLITNQNLRAIERLQNLQFSEGASSLGILIHRPLGVAFSRAWRAVLNGMHPGHSNGILQFQLR